MILNIDLLYYLKSDGIPEATLVVKSCNVTKHKAVK